MGKARIAAVMRGGWRVTEPYVIRADLDDRRGCRRSEVADVSECGWVGVSVNANRGWELLSSDALDLGLPLGDEEMDQAGASELDGSWMLAVSRST
jgi:hypothetical protein